jgi:hypothetical protein
MPPGTPDLGFVAKAAGAQDPIKSTSRRKKDTKGEGSHCVITFRNPRPTSIGIYGRLARNTHQAKL